VSFWSSETLTQRAQAEALIEPFQIDRVQSAAYELGLANQVFRTSDRPAKRRILQKGEQLVIPPGQFALLITVEKIRIPPDAIGFISIKAGIKFKGMVNISGFHVDPGFYGCLKFSVYNAGSSPIVLEPGAPTFLLWFASLDRETSDIYKGNHQNQVEITAMDVMSLQGEVPSPTALDVRLKKVEFWVRVAKSIVVLTVAGLLAAFASALVTWLLFDRGVTPSHQPSAIESTVGTTEQHSSRRSPSQSEDQGFSPPSELERPSQ